MTRDDLRRLRSIFRSRSRLRERLVWSLVLGKRGGAHKPRSVSQPSPKAEVKR